MHICLLTNQDLLADPFPSDDWPCDPSGTPYMLEINPNCGVYYPREDPGSADLCLMHDPEGHTGFTRRLIRAALRRRQPLDADSGSSQYGGSE